MESKKEIARRMVSDMYENIGLSAKVSSDQCFFEAKKCTIVAINYLIKEWCNESGRTAKQNHWIGVRSEVEKLKNELK
jgi:hypothetical protein